MKTMNKVNILWISDLVTPTGWSRVAHGIIKYLPKEEFNVTGLGINYFGDPHPYDFQIYPSGVGKLGDVYGFSRLEGILMTKKFDLVYILNDIWVIKEYLKALESFKGYRPKIVVYFPVDATDHDPEWYSSIPMVDKAVVYTKFGKEVAEKALPNYSFDIIPHGIDQEDFFPVDREKARKLIFNNPKLENSFIFLNANRNQPRKRLELTLEGFKLFSETKPENVLIYHHCGVMDSDLNITKLATRLGLEKRLIVTSFKMGVQTVPIEKLNLVYNSANVGVNTSLGEGWGLPSCEHAITGAPQIVPDSSACAEIFQDVGLLIPNGDPFIQSKIMTTGILVHAEDVAAQMEIIYFNTELYNKLSEASIKKFTSDTYNWKTIATQWADLFRGVL
jgi:glycosyltransferase involved in cell wall biosynthesis